MCIGQSVGCLDGGNCLSDHSCCEIANSGDALYTKDEMYIGRRSKMIQACTDAAENEVDFNGITLNANKYCSCVCDELIPKLYSWEMEAAVKNNTMLELFTKGDNFDIIMECVSSYMAVEDDFSFGYKDYEEYSDIEKSIFIKACSETFYTDSELIGLFTENEIKSYCSCAMEKLIRAGYSIGQLNEAENIDSEAFNEIVLPCMSVILNKENILRDFTNEYNKYDISGSSYLSEIKLNNYLDIGYRIKLEINGIVKYFTFDTGASDLVINSEMERELILEGKIKKSDYLDETEYLMADNTVVTARILKLNNIKIGDYTVDNIIVAVIDNGSLLCGLGLLNKFRKWNFNTENKILKIYK